MKGETPQYTTEAVQGLLNWAFGHPQVIGVIAETFPYHFASIRVMEKNGMVLLGAGRKEGTVKYGIGRETHRAFQISASQQ